VLADQMGHRVLARLAVDLVHHDGRGVAEHLGDQVVRGARLDQPGRQRPAQVVGRDRGHAGPAARRQDVAPHAGPGSEQAPLGARAVLDREGEDRQGEALNRDGPGGACGLGARQEHLARLGVGIGPQRGEGLFAPGGGRQDESDDRGAVRSQLDEERRRLLHGQRRRARLVLG
jgi:hypothetical protein